MYVILIINGTCIVVVLNIYREREAARRIEGKSLTFWWNKNYWICIEEGSGLGFV